jgi:hypothetical protein
VTLSENKVFARCTCVSSNVILEYGSSTSNILIRRAHKDAHRKGGLVTRKCHWSDATTSQAMSRIAS